MGTLYMIGNTHFDPVWLWRWDEAMASIRATFRSALERMQEEPEFRYSFSCPPVFEWIRQTDPEMLEEIRQRVSEGRWELGEAWWVQPDCCAAAGESYIRQGLYGQRYLMETFGRYSEGAFNIDSFGHSLMLPQILQKSGVRYACFMRPEPKHQELPAQFFLWRSPDGSGIPMYRVTRAYEKEPDLTPPEQDELIVFGVTDHGGTPTKRAIERVRESAAAIFSTLSGFFSTHTPDAEVTKELLTGDFGPCANFSEIKRRNREAEYALLNAERASLLAGRDDRPALTAAWHDVLFNQFHDILGGACIRDAYTDAAHIQGRAIASAREILHYSLQSVTRRIAMPGANPQNPWNIVLWNLNGAPFDGYVEAEVQWIHEFDWYTKGICLEDADGNRVPCQIVREKSVMPGFRSRFLFRAAVPAVGWRAYRLLQTGDPVEKPAVDPYRIRTHCLDVRFSEDGCVSEICGMDGAARCGRILVPVWYGDPGDTWSFNSSGYDTTPHPFAFRGFAVEEAGDLMTEIRGRYETDGALLEVWYRFYADADWFDVRWRVNWEKRHAVLKMESDLCETRHTAAVPDGETERGESAGDVPMGAWVRADGVTYVSGTVFAYGVRSGKLGITLLRSPIFGDLRMGELDESIDYDIIDRGVTEGGLRVAFGGSGWRLARAYQNPPVVIDEACHPGVLPTEGSFCAVETEGVELEALKRSEDGNGDILRLLETEGRARTAAFTLRGRRHETPLGPWEIRTLKFADGNVSVTDLLEREC